MRSVIVLAVVFVTLLGVISAQDYGDYARGGPVVRRRNNRGPVAIAAVSGVFGGVLGGWLGTQRAKRRFAAEKADLVTYLNLQEEVYATRENQWQTEYQRLYTAYEELEKELVERDYEEFKAPDADGDDMITRSEFNEYVRKFLASFPELSSADFPKFDEFDHDGDGLVSFDEWQQFLLSKKLLENASNTNSKTKSNQSGGNMLTGASVGPSRGNKSPEELFTDKKRR